MKDETRKKIEEAYSKMIDNHHEQGWLLTTDGVFKLAAKFGHKLAVGEVLALLRSEEAERIELVQEQPWLHGRIWSDWIEKRLSEKQDEPKEGGI